MDGNGSLTSGRLVLILGVLLLGVLLRADSALAQESTDDTVPSPLQQAGITGSVRAGDWRSTRSLDAEDHLAQ